MKNIQCVLVAYSSEQSMFSGIRNAGGYYSCYSNRPRRSMPRRIPSSRCAGPGYGRSGRVVAPPSVRTATLQSRGSPPRLLTRRTQLRDDDRHSWRTPASPLNFTFNSCPLARSLQLTHLHPPPSVFVSLAHTGARPTPPSRPHGTSPPNIPVSVGPAVCARLPSPSLSFAGASFKICKVSFFDLKTLKSSQNMIKLCPKWNFTLIIRTYNENIPNNNTRVRQVEKQKKNPYDSQLEDATHLFDPERRIQNLKTALRTKYCDNHSKWAYDLHLTRMSLNSAFLLHLKLQFQIYKNVNVSSVLSISSEREMASEELRTVRHRRWEKGIWRAAEEVGWILWFTFTFSTSFRMVWKRNRLMSRGSANEMPVRKPD
ncbi:unnamed protein product [Nesidiocoris tenuis]|uniref:Uncharacterized protein n=1 Tax=Nesidiocoris tenuis TaxID=355587 RepID=A0A6H5GPN7_9HEMI|nr:unnamed protein product [Nesidiocoris tenuis]